MGCALTAKIDSIAENYYNGFSSFLFMTRSVILMKRLSITRLFPGMTVAEDVRGRICNDQKASHPGLPAALVQGCG